MEVRPLHNKVLVAQNKDEIKSESGIILDNADSLRESRTGTVLAIGPKVTLVEVGDKVLLEWNKAQVVKIGEAQRVIVKEDDIVAVFDK
jgi:co-chaperonin GroES (HSP10)